MLISVCCGSIAAASGADEPWSDSRFWSDGTDWIDG